jgi:hypothetical protein
LYRRRREGNYTCQKNNTLENLMGNEDRYPVLDPNKTMINIINETRDTHKKNP